ncbi:hypothetical protein DdX_17876 [Ditylenchus destructor]|uniref:Uncharacterized protein n=1 Tax=Ditylenchus destructor TaxID=166010 RepID=A0AAD4MMM8_9BILA|nr:hypothetical protein DdX_17876 [Ditylenchus destructor]
MRLNNSEYCAANTKSSCCHDLKQCYGLEYPYYCQDAELFTTLAAIIEIPVDILDLVLSATIIFVSIKGKINGTFKWCVMNIAVFHLFYPIFGRLINKEILMPTYLSWGWSTLATDLVVNGVLVIGVQGVTTSIAGSLPLAVNRFLLTHQSRFYNVFFETGIRCFWSLLCYDIATFGIFYLLNMLVLLSNGKVISFPASVYYLTTISMVTVTNTVGLILMLFVLYHIHSSVKLCMQLDQKQMLQERKRVAYVIIAQSVINFLLCAWRLKSFYNVYLLLAGWPTYACYSPFLNFVSYFTYAAQEVLVCSDSLIYIFFLTAYREELRRLFSEVPFLRSCRFLRRNVIHVVTVSNV